MSTNIETLKKNMYRRIIIRGIIFAAWLVGLAGILLTGGMQGTDSQTFVFMIVAICAVGVVYTIRDIRRLQNTEYLRRAAIEQQDERNVLISYKATRLAVTILLCAAPIAMCIFAYTGQQQIINVLAVSVCLYLILYVICWYVMSKRG